ncbi:MAG: hypothetical protein ACREL5_09425 [Gemmatimonadales bacterium]
MAGANLRLRHAVLIVALLGLATCQSHDVTAPGSTLVATISLTTSAVIIAPLERLTATAIPRDSAGRALAGWMSPGHPHSPPWPPSTAMAW